MKKLLVATIAGTILLFALDYVWYALLMGGLDGECCTRDEPEFLWLIIGYILFSLAFAGIYDKTASRTTAPMRGIIFGLWMGLMVAVSINVIWYSLVTNMGLPVLMPEMIFGVVKYVLLGVVVGYAYGKTTGDGEHTDPEKERGKETGGGERGKETGGGE